MTTVQGLAPQVTAVGARQTAVLPADRWWRVWLTKHPIGGALISGFVATHIATIFGIWFHGIGLPDLNWPLVNGSVVDAKGSIDSKVAIGEFIHGFDGLVFTLIFAIVIFPFLSQAVRNRVSPASNMAKALIFSMVLATLSAGFMVPYVYLPHLGAGLFSTGYGWKIVFGIYLWHVVYGVNLGMMYNPLPLDHPDLA